MFPPLHQYVWAGQLKRNKHFVFFTDLIKITPWALILVGAKRGGKNQRREREKGRKKRKENAKRRRRRRRRRREKEDLLLRKRKR